MRLTATLSRKVYHLYQFIIYHFSLKSNVSEVISLTLETELTHVQVTVIYLSLTANFSASIDEFCQAGQSKLSKPQKFQEHEISDLASF